jgi:hypothetical protein
MCESAGIKLITVEQAFGDRSFMVTEAGNPMHLQCRTVEELWHKENMINMGFAHAMRMSPAPRELAWIDADCRPARHPKEWFEETWHYLQHFEIVQMWSQMVDVDHTGVIARGPWSSFMADYARHGYPTPVEVVHIKKKAWQLALDKKDDFHPDYYDGKPAGPAFRAFGSPGLAWAGNVDAINKIGGLMDFCIVGAGDWYMAHALIGAISSTVMESSAPAYERRILQWQEQCERWIKRDVGCVPTLMIHDPHGPKDRRQYNLRHKILADNGYNPDTDIKYDVHGLLQLETWDSRQMRLRDQLRNYFATRKEDSEEM